jgi:hypothetical protein
MIPELGSGKATNDEHRATWSGCSSHLTRQPFAVVLRTISSALAMLPAGSVLRHGTRTRALASYGWPPFVDIARDFGHARKLSFERFPIFPIDHHDRSIVSSRSPVPVVLMATDCYRYIGPVDINRACLAVVCNQNFPHCAAKPEWASRGVLPTADSGARSAR